MANKLRVAIVGPGRLGRALAIGLKRAGYRVEEIVARRQDSSQRKARALGREVGARAVTAETARLSADLVWFCVPDREIAASAGQLAALGRWKGKVAFHPSGALGSEELNELRRKGAAVAAVHPFMTFVTRSSPALDGVPFAVEGDKTAARLARRVVRELGGEAFSITRSKKGAYHAWGAFLSPLLVSLLATGETVAAMAGFSQAQARKWALPIMRQTVENYGRLGATASFSGPMVRGDAAVVGKHLQVLKGIASAHDVYSALARSALERLPARNRKELQSVLRRPSKGKT